MSVSRISWAQAQDIHVIAGAVSRTLDDFLVICHGTPEVNVWARNRPAGVNVRFRAAFNGALAGSVFSGFGISVDQNTGAVSVANPIPGGHRLRNFPIHAEVRDTTVAPVRLFVQGIHVHVLAAVTNRWLAPAPLTIRQGTNGHRFNVFAHLDDDAVGDISQLPSHMWASAARESIAADPDSGDTAPTRTESQPSQPPPVVQRRAL